MNMSETGGNPPFSINIQKFKNALDDAVPMKLTGKVTQVIGLVIESQGPPVTVGELCYVSAQSSNLPPIPAEVVGFREGRVLLMPVGEMQGIGPGCDVIATGRRLRVKVGKELLGRVLDGLGNPIDGKGPILSKEEYPLQASPPPPMTRPRIHDHLYVGVRSIDGLITLGDGQRIGIMAGSGVGKSTLLNTLLREERAIVTHIAGTTRDVIEEIINIKGIPLVLVDTAGIRKTDDIVENIGVEKSKQFIEKADLVLLVLDASKKLETEDIEVITKIKENNKKVIVLLNKIDLNKKINLEGHNLENIVEISAKDNIGIEDMQEKIYSYIVEEDVENSSEKLIITNIRHKTALEKTKDAIRNIFETIDAGMPMDLISVDLKEALDSLSEITGEISSEDILDHVFGNFCVGK